MDKSPQPLSSLPLHFVRRSDARRYILRVTREGKVRVTVPRHGTVKEAAAFVERHRAWIEKQLCKKPAAWTHGAQFLFRGEMVTLQLLMEEGDCWGIFGTEKVRVDPDLADYKGQIELYLQQLALKELPPRTMELASLHGLEVARITIRDQRSRWGSCSIRKNVSLNWRLVQTPFLVRDYIIIHELMHLREMNHSRKFWNHVAAACPDYLKAEQWLRKHSAALRG